jgi:hypothetical protein
MIGEKVVTSLGILGIKELVEKFKNNKVKFIRDIKTQEQVLKIYKSTESKFYNNYIKNKELNVLLNSGLILKKFEKNNEKENLQNLRDRLHDKSRKHLRFSQLVQNGLLGLYINYLLENKNSSPEEIENKILILFDKIETLTYFIKVEENTESIKKEIIRLLISKPEILLISSFYTASLNLKNIKEELTKQWKNNYDYKLSEDSEKLLIMFLERI